jgi:hypothetical protein
MRADRIDHEFVEFVPEQLAEATLYISMGYATAIHLCLCGCGQRVVTPLSPTDWRLTYDGESVSLDPSIGNWSFRCRSHYVIRRNHVIWAAAGRRRRSPPNGGATPKRSGVTTGSPGTAPIRPRRPRHRRGALRAV